jgi:hypothetical protein
VPPGRSAAADAHVAEHVDQPGDRGQRRHDEAGAN